MVAKGQRGGARPNSGRKSKAEELGLVALLDKCWSQTEREKCIRALAKKAKDPLSRDFMESAKLLLAYCFGKPTEKHELSNPDGSPLLAPVADAIAKIYGPSSPRT